MALISCKECGGKLSTSARACPTCGAPPPKRTSVFTWVFGGLFTIAVAQAVMSIAQADLVSEVKRPPTPDETIAALKRDREMRTVLAGAQVLKDGAKKPESFVLTSAFMPTQGVVCYTYSARNSFNDVTKAHYVVTDAVSSDSASAWNQLCAGKTGTDFSYISASIK